MAQEKDETTDGTIEQRDELRRQVAAATLSEYDEMSDSERLAFCSFEASLYDPSRRWEGEDSDV